MDNFAKLVQQKFCKSWLWMFFLGQINISKIKQRGHDTTLDHSENWVLISKREKGIDERTLFWNLSVNILLEIRNPFFHRDQIWYEFGWPQEVTFQFPRIAKNIWRHLIMSQKSLLCFVIMFSKKKKCLIEKVIAKRNFLRHISRHIV